MGTRRRRARVVASAELICLGALLASGCGSSSNSKPTPAAQPKPRHRVTDTAQGAALALLAKVDRAYAHVSAAEHTYAYSEGGTGHWIYLLREGRVVAEQDTFPVGRTASFALVRRGGGPTFMRDEGKTCWHPVGRESGQQLTDVGQRFLHVGLPFYERPRREHGLLLDQPPSRFWPVTKIGFLLRSARIKSLPAKTATEVSDMPPIGRRTLSTRRVRPV